MRKIGVRFVSDDRTQLALREWRLVFQNPIALIIQLCVGLVLGISGPFGTHDTVLLFPRLLYWVGVVYSTYAIGLLGYYVVYYRTGSLGLILRPLLLGTVNGVLISCFIVSLNLALFSIDFMPNGPLAFMVLVFLIAFFITVAAFFVIRNLEQLLPSVKVEAEPRPPALLDRLPIDKRGALLAISVEDHYVRVKTTSGETMILMRLSDAIGEVGDTRGDQIHRSHWVAYDHVTSARRDGNRAILTLSDGSEIPASRANISKLREAGLLPR